MTINQEHLDQWIAELRDPANQQTQGVLCRINEEGEKKYCCLGLGTELAGGTIVKYDGMFEATVRPEFLSVDLLLDGKQQGATAPPTFAEWLGFEVNESAQGVDFHITTLDVRRDDAFDEGAVEPEELWCAELNDNGFTFAQIADLLNHFGIERTDGQ